VTYEDYPDTYNSKSCRGNYSEKYGSSGDSAFQIAQLPTGDAIGETLGKEYLQFSVGMRVTPTMVKYLKKNGINEVLTAPRAPVVDFVMKPITGIPKLHPDWMARMAHQGIKPTILRAAHTGEESKIHGTHPVPAYAFGVEFGQGEGGRY